MSYIRFYIPVVFVLALLPLRAQNKISSALQVQMEQTSRQAGSFYEVMVIGSEQLQVEQFLNKHNLKTAGRKAQTLAVQAELRRLARSQERWLNDLKQAGYEAEVLHRYWLVNAVLLKVQKDALYFLDGLPEVGRIELAREHPVVMHEPVWMGPSGAKSPGGAENGLKAIKADQLWAMGYTGKGTKLLTFDTGLWPSHPAFRDRFLGWRVPLGQAWFAYDSHFPGDKFSSHGTHVTGTCLGLDTATDDTIGVAFNARFMGTDPIVSSLSDIRSLADIIRGYEWAMNPDGDTTTVDDMPDVINNSWGHPYDSGFDAGVCGGWISDMYLNMEAQGIINIQSAGNEGPGAGTVGSPAIANGSVVNNFAVGAVNGHVASYPIAGFSSRGPTVCGGSGTLLIKPEVVAPGVNVRSAVLNNTTLEYTYANYQGTSMASPHVSGLALLLREAFPDATATDIKTAIYQTAADLGTAGEDNTYGMGMIDAVAAFNWLANIYTPAPPKPDSFDIVLAGTSIPDRSFICSDTSVFKIFMRNSQPVNKQLLSFHFGFTGQPEMGVSIPSGTFAPFDSVELPRYPSPVPGWNQLHVRIATQLTEDDTLNNHYYVSIWQMPVMSLPYREDFETGHIYETDLYVGNPDGRFTWDTIANSSLPGSTHSAYMRFSRYSPRKGQRDELITPAFQLTGSPVLKMSFDLSYQLKFNGFKDSLIVLLSPDCGSSWTDTVYAKGPDSLNTTTKATMPQWEPQDANDWRTEIIDLSAFAGWEQLSVKFLAINGQGNNLFLDNINIWDGSGQVGIVPADGDKPLARIYPNPAGDEVRIMLTGSQPATVHITDLNGRVVLRSVRAVPEKPMVVETGHWAPGIYFVHLQTGSVGKVLKLVKF